ncbi:MAG: hypothetical protein E3J78_02380 [Candidatus Cloacimonadota bacterium]|nr:MAG: hypothetical protein E3J78_02380 [Candidatus Cloacimonadota bacterium]
MEDEKIEENEEMTCSVCSTFLQEENTVEKEDFIYCKECWNKKILKDRKILPVYAFFVVFFLFQLFFYMPALIHETRGFSSPLHCNLCVIIGVLCGMIAFEEVYVRLTRKLV